MQSILRRNGVVGMVSALVLAGALGACIDAPNLRWVRRIEIASPTTVAATLEEFGTPDARLSFPAFVAGLRDDPGFTVAWLQPDERPGTFREWVLWEMWAQDNHWALVRAKSEGRTRPTYDSAWHEAARYQDLELCLYDESVRFPNEQRDGDAGGWRRYVFAFRDGRLECRWYIGGTTDVKAWHWSHTRFARRNP